MSILLPFLFLWLNLSSEITALDGPMNLMVHLFLQEAICSVAAHSLKTRRSNQPADLYLYQINPAKQVRKFPKYGTDSWGQNLFIQLYKSRKTPATTRTTTTTINKRRTPQHKKQPRTHNQQRTNHKQNTTNRPITRNKILRRKSTGSLKTPKGWWKDSPNHVL